MWFLIFVLIVICSLEAVITEVCIREIKDLKSRIEQSEQTDVNANINNGLMLSDLKTRIDKCEEEYLKELKKAILLSNDVTRLKIDVRKMSNMSVFDGAKGELNEK